MRELQSYEVERLEKRFEELESAVGLENVVDEVMDDFDFGMFMEDEIYDAFENWKNKNNKKNRRVLKMYCVDVDGDGSEFELRFEIDGKIVDRKTTYCFDDVLYYSHDFFTNNCEKAKYNGMIDLLEINLSYKYY